MGLDEWDLCLVIYFLSKITLHRGYELDEFVLFSIRYIQNFVHI